MMLPVKHIPGPYEKGLQFCLLCGEVLCDYRNAAWPSDESAPVGFPEGEPLFIEGKNPTVYYSTEPIKFDKCK